MRFNFALVARCEKEKLLVLVGERNPVNEENFISPNAVHLTVSKHIKLLVNSAQFIDKLERM